MNRLTLERIFGDPDINGSPPTNLQFSPCGTFVTFLKSNLSDFEQLDLWRYDIETSDSTLLVDASTFQFANRSLSDEEKANRERKRIFYSGIVEYFLNPDGTSVLLPLNGVLLLYRFSTGEILQLSEESTFQTDTRFSADGRYLSFVQNKDIYVIDLLNPQKTIQLTNDASDTLANGLAEFVAQEEMHRFEGYWWSPDSRKLAFIQTDESQVMLSQRYEIDADRFEVFDQRYPYAGTDNATTRIGVIDIESNNTHWLDLPRESDDYLARVHWIADSSGLAIQLQSRDQQKLDLIFHDLESGISRTILAETSDSWINLHDDLYFFKSAGYFIWASERDGYNHLYLLDLDGNVVQQLSQGITMVSSLVGVDEDNSCVYFDGYTENPTEKHLYEATINKPDTPTPATPITPITPITHSHGGHQTTLNKQCTHYLDRFSSHDQPPQVALHPLKQSGTFLYENRLDVNHPLAPFIQQISQVETGNIKAEDGQDLYYRMIKPSDFDADKTYPAIVLVYGGPGVQRVINEWIPPWYHYMAQRGYILFQLDNRGSSNRGKQFESPIHMKLGDIEVRDQLKGVEYLSGLKFINTKRLGIYGHSYGGYMTLMLLMKSPESFAAGISVAPVTDWLLYDTHYTERYLGLPQQNPLGYSESGILNQIKKIPSKLLVIHGMADDNVLFTHSTKLFKKLQDMNVQFDMMTYPGAKHGLTGRQVKIHYYGVMDRFLDRWLINGSSS